MEVKDYLTMSFERSNAAQSLWNFAAVVVLGIMAFMAKTSGNVEGLRFIQVLITLGFLCFVSLNLLELRKISHQRTILANATITLLPPVGLSDLQCYLRPFPLCYVTTVHLFVDLATIFAIWTVPALNP
jgi:hypothetical protein